MRHSLLKAFSFLFIGAGILAGCATVLPSEYGATPGSSILPGPILALAGEGDAVVAANPEGIFLRKGGGEWEELEVPGIGDYRNVTSLAVMGEEICVGTDGEGLHIFGGGVWEVRTSRYGGLPDDRVLSVAFEGPGEGLPGDNLWVGTETGLARRGPEGWRNYSPEGEWMRALADGVSDGATSTFLGSGYGIGGRGDDSRAFRPPVTDISPGPGGVVFGGENAGFAILSPKGLATVRITEKVEILDLLMEEDVIWVGTSAGLVWGGLSGKGLGTPWPAHRKSVAWTGTLFATRDSRPFLYEWNMVGYNDGKVYSLSRDGESLWVAFGEPDRGSVGSLTGGESSTKPISDLRRYLSIDDHILRKEAFAYESYGKKTGILGEADSVLALPGTGGVWVGTSRGLFLLEK